MKLQRKEPRENGKDFFLAPQARFFRAAGAKVSYVSASVVTYLRVPEHFEEKGRFFDFLFFG